MTQSVAKALLGYIEAKADFDRFIEGPPYPGRNYDAEEHKAKIEAASEAVDAAILALVEDHR